MKRCEDYSFRHTHEQICVGWLVGLALGCLLGLQPVAEAKSMYIYVNDKGTSVMTNAWKHVPKQYRDSVKVMEFAEESEIEEGEANNVTDKNASDPISASGVMTRALEKVPSIEMDKQKLMLVGGGLIILVSFATMMLSRNMALKFAMKWLLMLAVVGTGYGWYFSSMGLGGFLGETGTEEKGQKPILERVRDETKMIEDIQNKKLMDIEKVLGEKVKPPKKRTP